MKNPYIKVVIECHTDESRRLMNMGNSYDEYKKHLVYLPGKMNIHHIAGYNRCEENDQVSVYTAGGDSFTIQSGYEAFDNLIETKYKELAAFGHLN